MAKRIRNKNIHFMVSEKEFEMIKENMQESGIQNFSIFARKMLINGYIIKPDYTAMKDLTKEFGYLNRNLNQITRRINETRSIHFKDILAIREIVNEMRTDLTNFLHRMFNKFEDKWGENLWLIQK